METSPAELCDINADGSCDGDDLTRRSLFRRNLIDGSVRESDILSFDISGDGALDANDLTTWLSSSANTNGYDSAYLPGDAESKRGPSWEPSEEDSTAEQLGSGIGNARRDSTASGLKSVLRDTYRVEVNGVSFYILALDQIERIAKTREDSAQGGHRTN